MPKPSSSSSQKPNHGSLSSIVSHLVRSQFGAQAPTADSVPDHDLDRHVADLLMKEAKEREKDAVVRGSRAYLDQGDDSDSARRKPTNKHFLTSIIRNVDDHNSYLKKQDQELARKRERDERLLADEWRRGREDEAEGRVRGWDDHERRDDRREDHSGREHEKGRAKESNGKGKERDRFESDVIEDEDDLDDEERRRRRRRERQREKDHDESSGSRRHRERPEDEGYESRKRRREEDSTQKHHSTSSRREDPESSSKARPRKEEERYSKRSGDDVSGDSRRHHHRHRERRESDDERPSKEKKNGHSSTLQTSMLKSQTTPHSHAQSISPPAPPLSATASPTHAPPPPLPPPPLPSGPPPSKMDKYFSSTYDPRLDLAPSLGLSSSSVLSNTSQLVPEGVFDGWNTMLQVVKDRKEEKEMRKERERREKEERRIRRKNRKLGLGRARSSGEEESGDEREVRKGKGEKGLMDTEGYAKKGETRLWDLGKVDPF